MSNRLKCFMFFVLAGTTSGCLAETGDLGTTSQPLHADDLPTEVVSRQRTALTCGNGTIEGDELCDPGNAPALCANLFLWYDGGSASCRSDCSGYDTTTCDRTPSGSSGVVPIHPVHGRAAEVVKPGLRDPTRWGSARCMDGQPFDMLVRLAPEWSPHPDRWVVYIQGGGFCDDDAKACDQRHPRRTNSWAAQDQTWRALYDQTGVLSTDRTTNQPFATANHAYLHYCSSDIWSGADEMPHKTSFSPVTFFTGRINARSAIEILKQRYGLDDSNPDTEMLFVGTSAGGHGVHQNARMVAEQLPQTAASRRIRLVPDGAYLPQWQGGWRRDSLANANSPNAATFDEGLSNAYDFWGSSFDSECEADNPGQEHRCVYGSVIYPYLAGPTSQGGLHLRTMEVIGQHDTVYTSVASVNSPPGNPLTSSAAWRSLMQTELQAIPSVFSGWDDYHVLSGETCRMDYGPAQTPSGRNGEYRRVLWRFWWNMPNEQIIHTTALGAPQACP